MILGLMSSETFKAHWSLNARRRIFYKFPQGAAPLMALLSLLEPESTDKPEYGWYEKDFTEQQAVTVAIDGDSGPFSTTGTNTPLTEAGWTATVNTIIRVRLEANGSEQYLVNNTVWVMDVPLAAGGFTQLYGQVTSIPATNQIEIRLLQAVPANVLNNQLQAGLNVIVIGSAYGEGVVNNSSEKWNPPILPVNFTQILRKKFSFPRTALKPGLKFDKSGMYKDKAKENSLRHMMDLEKCFLFGTKSSFVTTIDGEDSVVRTTGGVLYWLQQYEAAFSIFRGGDGVSVGPAAVTLDSDDDKRIINNAAGTVTPKSYAKYLERVFRRCNNKAQEKLVLCGSGFLETINQMYFGSTTLNSNLPLESTYGMNVVRHQTPHGLVYYKSHPLFNLRGSRFYYDALFLDVHNLIYRPLNDSDTKMVDRSLPNADKRVDEWITEAGLELRMPESHLWLRNVRDYLPA
jgi:hypothetical protein